MTKLELVEPHEGERRPVRRGAKGQYIDEVAASWSLAASRRRYAPTVKPHDESA